MRKVASLVVGIIVGIIVDILAHMSVHTTDAAFWLGLLAAVVATYIAYETLPEARFPRR